MIVSKQPPHVWYPQALTAFSRDKLGQAEHEFTPRLDTFTNHDRVLQNQF